jgi:hypothetical protein
MQTMNTTEGYRPNPRGRAMLVDDEKAPRDEVFVADWRADLSPTEQVENKLIHLLKSAPVFVSHLQQDSRPSPR